MEFRSLAEICEKLEKITKRDVMVALVSDFLRSVSDEEIEPVVSMMLGRALPKHYPKTLNISWTTLSRVIKRLAGAHWSAFHQAFRTTGDVGAAIQAVFERRRATDRQALLLEKPLTILDVRKIFEGIASAKGEGSREKRERLLEGLFSRATPLEAKYLTKIIVGEMRTGFQEGLMENAVAEAFLAPLKDVQLASMLTGDISEVAYLCKKYGRSGIANLGFKIFRPVKPMLAQMATDLKEVFEEHGGKTALEHKLDGARVQIHLSNGEVRIFSRRLMDITRSLPEIVSLIRDEVKAKEAILEGEVIAVGEDSKPMPF